MGFQKVQGNRFFVYRIWKGIFMILGNLKIK
jgi:hypothetical protein